MAPRQAKEPTPIDEARREFLEDVLAKLSAPMLDEVLLADGTPTATVLLAGPTSW